MSPAQRALTFMVALILISCLGFAERARADIIECVDEAGAVTFTDVPCKSAADAKRGAARYSAEVAQARNSATSAKATAGQHGRPAKSENRLPSYSGLDTDVATLKAAKSSLLMMERASAMARHQALASRD
jgi:hypothetical protein